jgi:hypothetical protein
MPSRVKKIIKIKLDIVMTILLSVQMAYLLAGQKVHEWTGTVLFLLVLVHNILSRNWYKNLTKGAWSFWRTITIVINVLAIVSFIGLILSGLIMSSYVFDFIHISGWTAKARIIHLFCAYWGLILLALHLGLNWEKFSGLIGRHFLLLTRKTSSRKFISTVVAFIFAFYGLKQFIQHNISSYLFLQNMFVYFDLEKSIFIFIFEYLAIIWFFAFITHYLRIILRLKTKLFKRTHLQQVD